VSRETKRSPWIRRGIVIALGAVLLIAMALSTTVKTATEGAAVAAGLDPDKSFSAADFAATTFAAVQKDLPAKAADLPTIAPEVIADLATAGKKYGQDLGAGSYAIPVKLSGKVTAVDENFLTLEVAGMQLRDPGRTSCRPDRRSSFRSDRP
jgi:hypothetical protein